MNNSLVIILSGGMDSATLIDKALQDGHKELYCLSFDYGQKHKKELECARLLTQRQEVKDHKIINLDVLNQLNRNSALTSNTQVPEGHYSHPSMTKTVVHNRNMLMLTIAHAYAIQVNADAIAYGCHNGDSAIYPDCRPKFVESLEQTLKLSNDGSVGNVPKIYAPFLNTDKIGILKQGLELGTDYSKTWTCYNGREKACGKCGSCVERLEAFKLNNIKDPLQYEVEV